jgi:uncharacterized membrane protein YhaH (DUF805 family)
VDWKDLFFNPNGRISRKDYWLGILALLVVSNLLHLILGVGTLISFGLFYCWTCVFSKRLHDMGRSGWTQVAPHIINIICIAVLTWIGAAAVVATFFTGRPGAAAGFLLGGLLPFAVPALLVAFVALINTLLFVVWLGVAEGEPGANAHGETLHLLP